MSSAKKPPPAAADGSNRDEEQDLLASVNASLRDHSAYETNVLRQATHRLAPTLSQKEPFVLPNLGGLGTTDLTVLHAVLRETRRKIKALSGASNDGAEAAQAADLLHMKEQILLGRLSALGAELPVRPHEERAAEQARARRLVDGGPAATATAIQQPSLATSATALSTAEFGLAPPLVQRKRVPMMKRKRIEATAANADDEDEKPSALSAEELAKLKELRLERRQRREARRKQLESVYSSSEEEEFNSVDEATEDEQEDSGSDFESGPKVPNATVDDNNESGKSKNIDENSMVEADGDSSLSNKASATTTAAPSSLSSVLVDCPLCQEKVAVGDGSPSQQDMDAALSRHMAQCQNQQQRRSTRRSARTATANNINYADEAAEDVPHPRKRAASKPANQQKLSAKRKKSKTSRPPAAAAAAAATAIKAVDDIDECDYEDRVDDWIEHGLSRMKTMRERDDSEASPGAEEYPGGLLIPEWMNNRLFGYQREGLKWLWDLHQQMVGGVIGDEMGLGKTVQSAAFLGAAAASRKLKSVLIVAPATMLRHWLSELAVWAPGLRRILIHTSGGDVDGVTRNISSQLLRKLSKWLKQARANRVDEPIDDEDWETLESHSFCGTGYAIVTTYENLRRNADVYTRHDFSYVLLDEAQKIKNPDADITLVCKRIRTPHRLAISGTPIQNDLRELWTLFDFVFPGRLGTLPAFEQEFSVPIKRGGYSNATPMQAQLAYRCALTLRDLIEPFMLRRLKKNIAEVSRMPGKTEHVLFCRLSQRQRAMYEAYIKSDDVVRLVRGSTGQLFGAITMLRKICNHPDLVCDPSESSLQAFLQNGGSNIQLTDDEGSEFDDENDITDNESMMQRSGKLEVLSKILPLWHKQGHRILVFCQWKKTLDIIQRFITLKGWKFARLDGNTNIASRQRLVDTFNSDESYFGMLCTTRTGGVGLNLTGANRILIYDPDFNPSSDAQARERSWRFGQEKEVTVYRLITAGTIEEKIYQRQIFKTALSNKVLQDPKQRRLFSQRDLRDLFSLGEDSGSVRSGGDGITETSKVTRGIGVVDADVDLRGDSENDDNTATLKKVMKSQGLAGIFDHHSVEFEHKRKSTTVREMEEHAKRVSKEAVEALKESVSAADRFTPTWTGSNETQPSRFGPSAAATAAGFTAGVIGRNPTPSVAAGPMSSKSLLASIRSRSATVETGGKTEPDKQYTQLLVRLKRFVGQHKPTTEQILAEFEDCVPDGEVAIFRGLLKSCARINEGRWYLLRDDKD